MIVTLDRMPEIEAAFQQFIERSPAQRMKYIDYEYARANFVQAIAEERVHQAGDYIVLYDYGPIWCSPKLFLFEEVVLRVGKVYMNPVSNIIELLEVEARKLGAVGVLSGDTQIGLMNKYYLEAGYSPIGTQFMKELDYGEGS